MALLGLDLGTSTVKAGLLTDAGEWVIESVPVAGDLWAGEFDPRAWWTATVLALRHSAATHSLANVKAVAAIGNTPTLVLVDRHGQPVYPALLWSDTRAVVEADALQQERSLEDWTRIYGGFIPISAAYASAKLRWLARHHPTVVAQTAVILQPKDYLNYRLTDQFAGDPWTSKGIVHLTRPGDASPLTAIGLSENAAPPCYDPIAVIGTVTDAAALSTGIPVGVPVMAGWSDTLGAVLSLGLGDCDGFILSGTSESIGVMTQIQPPHSTQVFVAPVWNSGYQIVYGPVSSGVSTVRWAESILGISSSDKADVDISQIDVFFVPYLSGQRSPLWHDTVRGAWIGLNDHVTRAHLIQAVWEGVVAAERDVLEAVTALTALSVKRLVVTGGGAHHPGLNFHRAALLQTPLYRALADPVWGAVLLAYWGSGGHFPQNPTKVQQWERLPTASSHEHRYVGFQRAKMACLGLAQT